MGKEKTEYETREATIDKCVDQMHRSFAKTEANLEICMGACARVAAKTIMLRGVKAQREMLGWFIQILMIEINDAEDEEQADG